MENIYQRIQDSLVRRFKGLFPDYDIVCEEIPRPENAPPLEDYIFLDIIPVANETVSRHHTDRRILIDAAIHSKAETNAGYRAIGAVVDAAIRPVLQIGDRAITIPDMGIKIVDRVLHCTFTLAFRDSTEAEAPFPLMEELAVSSHIERA